MQFTRRETIKLAGAAAVAAASSRAFAQDVLAGPTPARMPLHEFVQDPDLMNALRRGVRAMKARPPSDPLSWFFQAAIHGVTIDLIRNAAVRDPNLLAVDQQKFWNQCPHFGQASANFLPWHRGYTYYFERILRAHTGEPRFALPYWDYHRPDNYLFPRPFGIRRLDQPLDGDSDNPLYHRERNTYFCDWQHWSNPTDFRPYSQLTADAVDWSRARNSPIFFGATEREGLGGAIADEDISSRGLLESFPHDPIHRLVGGLIPRPPLPNPDDPEHPIPQDPTAGGMAYPPTAGFDPIFCVHHSNLDRLWAEWACLPGKQWGRFPPQEWFDGEPWYFYDVRSENGTLRPVEVNRPRKYFFSYRALGISFKYADATATPLELPATIPQLFMAPLARRPASLLARIRIPSLVTGALPSRVAIESAGESLRAPLRRTGPRTGAGRTRILMRLSGINLGTVNATGFEVHLVRDVNVRPVRGGPSFVGTIALFRHDGHAPAQPGAHAPGAHASDPPGRGASTPSDTFDVTDVLRAAGETDPSRMFVVIVPYSLSATVEGRTAIVESSGLAFDSVEFLVSE